MELEDFKDWLFDVLNDADSDIIADIETDEKMFRFIRLVAERAWQGRKWRRQFEILFKEYPELVMDSYEHELKGRPWKEYCAICRSYEELAESKRGEIVARFKQLVKIK